MKIRTTARARAIAAISFGAAVVIEPTPPGTTVSIAGRAGEAPDPGSVFALSTISMGYLRSATRMITPFFFGGVMS